ncbi:sigma-70 family RNA polymerase sigma factor [Herbaspirillum sp. WKF16]|uniref:sigma-70 family RNA polymerase sigma factor n=1 Tax=Herbaspirillum sp. WKF16 TaxID=3028312 RepID=UPI0023A9800C|nr:sigma-70 family RNA polymerase sigma factor [Herbaspirillum sp. WKF16]WDZ95821.1 sigma-70 family RNA polymerase sigma factor [Herbaspirillum sp. WKF16]
MSDVLLRHYDELVEHVRRRFGDKNFAHEVVHEVYVQVMRTSPSEEAGTPLVLLKHISTCKAIDLQRASTARSQWQETVEVLPEIAGSSPDGELHLRGKQLVDSLERIVGALPPRCREVFLLHKLQGMQQEEVATMLGISRKMVVKHMERAMSTIRPLWNDDQVDTAYVATLAGKFPGPEAIARGVGKRRLVRKIAAFTAMFLVSCGSAWMFDPAYDSRQVVTAIGEISTLELADGSRIIVNADSELHVESHLFSRRFKLARGEASFSVAHTFRSFTVQANRTLVTDIGTVFDVRNLPNGAVVSVQQGAVEVRAENGEAKLIHTNQAIRSADGLLGEPQPHNAETDAAWTRGKLCFNSTSLKDAIEDMQRYTRQKLVLEGHAVGTLKISGEYDITKIDDLIQALPAVLPVQVRSTADAIVISGKSERSK